MNRHQELQAIAADLSLCAIGELLTKGPIRQRYVKQRKACMARIKEMNREDGLDQMTDDELLAELTA